MNKIRISAVSYTNSKPFVYGISRSPIADKIDLSLDIPADCASKLIHDQVDIGLVPIAVLPEVPNGQIVSDYCIGSVGAVNSVFIFSQVPVKNIQTVKLDPQSRTSNNLAKVLLKFYWKKDVRFLAGDENTDAIVLIGDRTFNSKSAYPYVYDMGEAWMTFTGLPFVYAAWVANRQIEPGFLAEFNEALGFGVKNVDQVIAGLPETPGIDLKDYLTNKLDFPLTDKKREAITLFLSYIARL
ncbi:menaquinone biosynthetic enzyme MqnA/MqnD family protein [Pedobacter deserti]|uniref:menaquinone biosynthetic enzyme MqnA/MqnD family protein n=1 Tax=Pedobacter deserti TaxID=2817382 RepID=UPI00210CEB1B|nr:menaquinone biosynthesis protein [Pedobacter sp. SYSU D00382]